MDTMPSDPSLSPERRRPTHEELYGQPPPVRRKRDKGPFCPMCDSSYKRRFLFLPRTQRRHWGCIKPNCLNYHKSWKDKTLKKEVRKYNGWRFWFRIRS